MSYKKIITLVSLAIAVIAANETCAKDRAPDRIAGSAYAELTADTTILNTQPWVIPAGYQQRVISDEGRLSIYPGSDWTDMNLVNETGRDAGRYLYRTHEVRPPRFGSEAFKGGAISVVDLTTGDAKVLVQRKDWEAMDGLAWTPWNTVLFGEEVDKAQLRDPDFPQAERGLVYEMKPDTGDPTKAVWVKVRPMLGSAAHEGIATDSSGNVYVIDEHSPGAIYKFVPQTYGDLSKGQLYALKVDDNATRDGTGPAQWIALDMKLAPVDARTAAENVGATRYVRPEDLERIGNVLYVAITGEARVLSISLGGAPVVKNFVKAGMNVPVEDRRAGVTGFKYPDNLARGPDGSLWIIEDNVPSDIWVARPGKDGVSSEVYLFASLKDKEAEGTGIYFGKDPNTLFVNVQHSATGNDKTMAIIKLH